MRVPRGTKELAWWIVVLAIAVAGAYAAGQGCAAGLWRVATG